MKTKRYEDSDSDVATLAEVASETSVAYESAEEPIGETLDSEDVDAAHIAQGSESEAADDTDTDNATDSADNPPSSGSGPDGPAADGNADSSTGTDGDGDADSSGNGDADGSNSTGTDGEEDNDTKPDNPDNPGGTEFAQRFLTSGASVTLGSEALAGRREALAMSLLAMAIELLAGRVPGKALIPLMDAVLAREAVAKARKEGEIAGRNALIEEQLMSPPVGAPDLNGAPIARSRRQAASIFDLADMAR